VAYQIGKDISKMQDNSEKQDIYNEEDPSLREDSDRRDRPTKMFSRYTIFGRRRQNRRDSDPTIRYYVDWISGFYLKVLIAVAAFIIIDAFSTLHIMDNGGGEANPLMDWMIQRGVGWFIFVKFCTAIVGFMVLAVHRFFPLCRPLAGVLLLAYGGIVCYHVYLLALIHI
jgi:Domain of unknown function (DUF5658)